MTLPDAFVLAMASTCLASLVGALWLLYQSLRLRVDDSHGPKAGLAHFQAEAMSLAGFCLVMTAWCSGHWLAAVNHSPGLAQLLILINPLMPTFFLHFVCHFLKRRLRLPPHWFSSLPWLYACSLVIITLSYWLEGVTIRPWREFAGFVHLQAPGWLNLAYTVWLGLAAHLLLLFGWRHSHGNQRRSIVAMFFAGGWGLLLATSFIYPSLGLDWYPYPMLALPSYVLLLIYAVLRYQQLRINRIAHRLVLGLTLLTLVMGIMAVLEHLVAALGFDDIERIPFEWQLLYAIALLMLVAICFRPMQRLADRLIYGGELSAGQLQAWQQQLNNSHSWHELVQQGQRLWQQTFALDIDIQFKKRRKTRRPTFLCQQAAEDPGYPWVVSLEGWQDVPPGLCYRGEIFATLLGNACAGLSRSLKLAEIEKKLLDDQHLVELGGLTAAIAHELRNPLNIIAMAATQTDATVQQHIKNQISRADLLIKDLLSYSGYIELNRKQFVLRPLLQSLAGHVGEMYRVDIDIDCPGELEAFGDPDKLEQILVNLLENAAAFVQNQPGGRILIRALASHLGVAIAVHNNGPAIPDHLVPQLFQPFVSKRQGGSGLGLAIVRRLVDAHQGQISLSQMQIVDGVEWPVTFNLELPGAPHA